MSRAHVEEPVDAKPGTVADLLDEVETPRKDRRKAAAADDDLDVDSVW